MKVISADVCTLVDTAPTILQQGEALSLTFDSLSRYKTHLLFPKKKEEKDYVEAKVFKDTSGAENTKEDPPNGKEAASPLRPTANSIEAEV